MTTTKSLLLSSVIGLALLTSCEGFKSCPKAKGPIEKETRQVSDFFGIEMRSSGTVYIEVDSSLSAPELEIETNRSIMEHISTKVRNGKLVIRHEPCVRKMKSLRVFIKTPQLSSIDVSGSADVKGQNMFTTERMNLNISGSGSIDLRLMANSVNADISGSGDISLIGDAETADIDINGSGDFRGLDLKLDNCFIDISGSGTSRVWVNDFISVDISGSGDVHYKGNPETDINISGSGDVSRL